MDKQLLKDELKKAIENFRLVEEEEINGNNYVNSTTIVAELVVGNVIDKVVDKLIPDGAEILTKQEIKQIEDYTKLMSNNMLHFSQRLEVVRNAEKRTARAIANVAFENGDYDLYEYIKAKYELGADNG